MFSALLLGLLPFYQPGLQKMEQDKSWQEQRVAALEEYYDSGEYVPCNEADFVEGDLAAALEAGVKYNELSFIATHNSYQTMATREIKSVYKTLDALSFGAVDEKAAEFDSPVLTDQLNSGIRSIELDVETVRDENGVSFRCMHAPSLDMGTSCYDLKLALKEISMWSDNNPGHLPISIIIEPKELFVPLAGMEFLSLDSLTELDSLFREALGEKLFTPADMLGSYSSFAQLRAEDGWCELRDTLGKVLILLHDTKFSEDYVALDSSLKTQAMFPMFGKNYVDKPYASFLIINKPELALSNSKQIIEDGNFIVRTRSDTFVKVTPANRTNAFLSRAQIISTDYPPIKGRVGYTVDFGDAKTVKILSAASQ